MCDSAGRGGRRADRPAGYLAEFCQRRFMSPGDAPVTHRQHCVTVQRGGGYYFPGCTTTTITAGVYAVRLPRASDTPSLERVPLNTSFERFQASEHFQKYSCWVFPPSDPAQCVQVHVGEPPDTVHVCVGEQPDTIWPTSRRSRRPLLDFRFAITRVSCNVRCIAPQTSAV